MELLEWLGDFPTGWCLAVDYTNQLLRAVTPGSPSILPFTPRSSSLFCWLVKRLQIPHSPSVCGDFQCTSDWSVFRISLPHFHITCVAEGGQWCYPSLNLFQMPGATIPKIRTCIFILLSLVEPSTYSAVFAVLSLVVHVCAAAGQNPSSKLPFSTLQKKGNSPIHFNCL